MSDARNIVKMQGITKHFGFTVANSEVDFDLGEWRRKDDLDEYTIWPYSSRQRVNSARRERGKN